MKQQSANSTSLRLLVLAALLAALGCVATLVLRVPSPTGGYMNLGDIIVLLGAYLLGPLWGAASAGVGSALADIIGGYPLYAPATLLIKAAMALLAAWLYHLLGKKNMALVVGGTAAELLMLLGYWIYDGFLMQNLIGAAAGIPGNLMQAAFGLTASSLLTIVLKKNPYICAAFPKL